jgi:hypothetical protein
MATVRPREALAYALGREMAVLYAVVVGGYVGLILGAWFGANWALRGGGAGLVGQLLAAALFLGGFVAILAGLVGLVYKVIADANHVARA